MRLVLTQNYVTDNFSDETRQGFGSLLYVRCDCGVLNLVLTNKRNRNNDAPRSKPTFTINDKVALGKYKIYAMLKELTCWRIPWSCP